MTLLDKKIYFQSKEALDYWIYNIITPSFGGNKKQNKFIKGIVKIVCKKYPEKTFGISSEDLISMISESSGLYTSEFNILALRKWEKNLVFVFKNNSENPYLIYKLTEDNKTSQNLENEKNVLNILNKRNLYVPKPKGNGVFKGWIWHSQKVLSGTPLVNIIGSVKNDISFIKKMIYLAENYLRSLRYKNNKDVADLYDINNNGLFSRIDDNVRKFIMKELGSIKGKQIPNVIQHKDFQPENILIKDDKLNVFDWEYASVNGVPLSDFFLFSAWNYSFCLTKGKKVVSFKSHFGLDEFKSIFYDKNDISDNVKKLVVEHCFEMNIPPETINFLFLLFVIKHLSFNSSILEYAIKRRFWV